MKELRHVDRLILKNQLALLLAARLKTSSINVNEKLTAMQLDEQIIETRIALEQSR